MPENHDKPILSARASQPRITVHHVFVGEYTTAGRSRTPLNRFVYGLREGARPNALRSGSGTGSLAPGHWVLVPAGLEIEHDQHPGIGLVSVHFSVELHAPLDLFSGCGRLFAGNEPSLAAAIRALAAGDGSYADAFRLRAILSRIVAEALDEGGEAILRRQSLLAWYAPLLAAFRAEPAAPPDVAAMAAAMKMGASAFAKRFKADAGVSPKAFFNRLRAEAAARELAGGLLNVGEVADRFGFSSEFYFSRFFKRHMGQSPRDFRLAYRERLR